MGHTDESGNCVTIKITKDILQHDELRNWGYIADEGGMGGAENRETFVWYMLVLTVYKAK